MPSNIISLAGLKKGASKEVAFQNTVAKSVQNDLLRSGSLNNGESLQIAVENLSPAALQEFESALESKAMSLVDTIATVKGMTAQDVLKEYSTAQLTAGAMAMAAASNPAEYSRNAYHNVAMEGAGVSLVTPEAGAFGFTENLHPALEAFDNSTISEFMGVSTVFNMEVAAQRELPEAFFPTVTVGAETGGLDMHIRVPYVYSHFLRDTSGDEVDFHLQRAIDAVFDYKILQDDCLDLYPEVQLNGSNAAHFADAADVPPVEVQLRGRKVNTAPLRVGMTHALIDISQHSLMDRNGTYDAIDSLHPAVGIKNVYLKLGADVTRHSTAALPTAQFHQGAEYDGRQLFLNLRTNAIQFNKNTTIAKGGAVTEAILSQIVTDELVVNIRLAASGDVDLETSNVTVGAVKVAVDSVFDANGVRLPLDSGVGLDIVNGLADLELVYFDPDSRVSNLAYAERGLQVNFRDYKERIAIPLGMPISIPSPLSENRGPEEMNTLISLVKARTSSNGISKLEAIVENFQQYVSSNTVARDRQGSLVMEGIGRHMLRTYWFNSLDLDLEAVTLTQNSTNKVADVMSALVNAIRDMLYHAIQATGIEHAIDLMTGGKGERVKAIIGTSPLIARYLQLVGDTRMFGESLPFEIVQDADDRLIDKIYVTLTRDTQGPDPLRFGSHLMIPELITARTAVRGGRTFNEAMVQTRSVHVMHSPILGVINVQNLSKVMTEFAHTNFREV